MEDNGCCGGECGCHDLTDKQTPTDGECCGGDCNCDHDQPLDSSDQCCGGGCGHGDQGTPVHLSAEDIAKVNEIMGDIDDPDLEERDLTDEEVEQLKEIFFKTAE